MSPQIFRKFRTHWKICEFLTVLRFHHGPDYCKPPGDIKYHCNMIVVLSFHGPGWLDCLSKQSPICNNGFCVRCCIQIRLQSTGSCSTTMVYRFISQDVKIATIWLFEWDLIPLDLILDCCNFSEHTWYQVLQLYGETSNVINSKPSLWGHIRLLDVDDLQYLLHLVRQNPDYFLDELLCLLKTNRLILVHYIHNDLSGAGSKSWCEL